ncbi:ABC transporter substrate-binding protein [Mumia zhuanghuii]|uniref:ABC transporter substrate-binding protein n=2 Tax=Mumia TaxID=1546255 RepID=A0ABW1QL23_9ACTN|nr:MULTISPECIES: ABC transporter substrate-binding protein [Mumia]KAA1424923.1 ABC transporter substrate-binding protein [Mumia zhuanghuii]
MSVRTLRRSLALGAVAALVLPLAACSSDVDADAATEEAKTRTVASQFGDVELPVEPKAALGMYTTDVDILITLGFPLATMQPIRGDGWTTFPEFFPTEELEGVEPFANYPDYNYEKILEAQPDFILNGLGYDDKVVKRLPEIAPTYSIDAFSGESWMTHFKKTAEDLDRVDEYEAWMEKYEARVAEVKAAIGDSARDLVVAPVGSWEGKVNSSCYSGVECQAFKDLGLTIFPGSLTKGGEGLALSGEQVGQLKDVDVAFTIKIPGEKGDKEYAATEKELMANPLWAGLPFVENDQIFTYDMEMTYGSPSGQMAFLDVVEEALGS